MTIRNNAANRIQTKLEPGLNVLNAVKRDGATQASSTEVTTSEPRQLVGRVITNKV
jgi:hypothetical protein